MIKRTKALGLLLLAMTAGLCGNAHAELTLRLDTTAKTLWFTGTDTGTPDARGTYGDISWSAGTTTGATLLSQVSLAGLLDLPGNGFAGQGLSVYDNAAVRLTLLVTNVATGTLTGKGPASATSYASLPAAGQTYLEGLLGKSIPLTTGTGFKSLNVRPPPPNTFVPPDLNPGDLYRLVFVTSGTTTGESPYIGHYNTFVTDEANLSRLTVGLNWFIIGSTSGVNARENTGTQGDGGVPIYRLDGQRIVDNNADLWDGYIAHPINIDQFGSTVGPFQVWTGTMFRGLAYTLYGSSPAGLGAWLPETSFGLTDQTNSRWISSGDEGKRSSLHAYALSEVLTVPFATADFYTTKAKLKIEVPPLGVLANDSPALFGVRLVAGPSNAKAFTFNPDGSFSYTPAPGFSGTDTFQYTASYDDGVPATPAVELPPTTVTIFVSQGAGQAPVASPDDYLTHPGVGLNIPAEDGVLANDTDPDSSAIFANLVGNPQHGTLTLNEDGSFTYAPEAGFIGTDSFTYYATDGKTASGVATVTIEVNNAPVANPDTYGTVAGTDLQVAAPGVLANDSDEDPLVAILIGDPQHGTVTLEEDGSFTYTPEEGFTGTDVFFYLAIDGVEQSDVVQVAITVTPANTAPLAVPESFTTLENSPLTVDPPGVLANDIDSDGDPLTAVQFIDANSGPFHGTVVLNSNGSFTYTPNSGYSGMDQFEYYADDGAAQSPVPVAVLITVQEVVQPVNKPPVTKEDYYTVEKGQTLVVGEYDGLLRNDYDPDGDPITSTQLVIYPGPYNGSVTVAKSGAFTYIPNDGFTGVDIFMYACEDGKGGVSYAVVSIHVNGRPVGNPDTYTVVPGQTLTVSAPGVLGNDTDPENDPLKVLVVMLDPEHGTLTLNVDGSFTYTPTAGFIGTDTFYYTPTDGQLPASATLVTITVEEPNSAPVARNDSYQTEKNTPLTIYAPGVLNNDTDPDGDTIAAPKFTGSSVNGGTLTVFADGSFEYAPPQGFVGVDTFTYQVTDGRLLSEFATVSITVYDPSGNTGGIQDGRTIGYWSNQNGQYDLTGAYDGTTLKDGISSAIQGLNLRDASGTLVTLGNYADVALFLLTADSRNSANMLSAQMLATVFNTLVPAALPYVKPSAKVKIELVASLTDSQRNALVNLVGPTPTVADLITKANIELGSNSYLTKKSKSLQDALMKVFDAINNNYPVYTQ